MNEKTIMSNTGTPEVTQSQPTQMGNLILNELNRPRSISDTVAVIQFCVNVGILPDDYTTQIIAKRQDPYVPPQVQPTPKAGD